MVETVLSPPPEVGTLSFCEGCNQEQPDVGLYLVRSHGEHRVGPVRYCSDCRDLASVDWNGTTAWISEAFESPEAAAAFVEQTEAVRHYAEKALDAAAEGDYAALREALYHTLIAARDRIDVRQLLDELWSERHSLPAAELRQIGHRLPSDLTIIHRANGRTGYLFGPVGA